MENVLTGGYNIFDRSDQIKNIRSLKKTSYGPYFKTKTSGGKVKYFVVEIVSNLQYLKTILTF